MNVITPPPRGVINPHPDPALTMKLETVGGVEIIFGALFRTLTTTVKFSMWVVTTEVSSVA